MKINLMTDYAIRTIKNIAEDEKGIVTSISIAEKEEIPHGVLMKVLRKLRFTDIVVSHQGRGEVSGGYSLQTPVDEITLLNIIEIMEGPVEINFGARQKHDIDINEPSENIKKQYQNGIEMEYDRIIAVIRQEMNRYSIGQLLKMNVL